MRKPVYVHGNRQELGNGQYEFVAPSLLSKLTPFQEMILTLVKLRNNPSMQDLAYRFGVHCSTSCFSHHFKASG